jgi:hypothetical protein
MEQIYVQDKTLFSKTNLATNLIVQQERPIMELWIWEATCKNQS